MSEKEGILQIQPLGRWAVCRPGLLPVKITSGELFRVEVDGARGLQLARMEYRPGTYYLVGCVPRSARSANWPCGALRDRSNGPCLSAISSNGCDTR
jgi:hypothetical protein